MQAFFEEELRGVRKSQHEKTWKKFRKSIDKEEYIWYTLWAVLKEAAKLDLEN